MAHQHRKGNSVQQPLWVKATMKGNEKQHANQFHSAVKSTHSIPGPHRAWHCSVYVWQTPW